MKLASLFSCHDIILVGEIGAETKEANNDCNNFSSNIYTHLACYVDTIVRKLIELSSFSNFVIFVTT